MVAHRMGRILAPRPNAAAGTRRTCHATPLPAAPPILILLLLLIPAAQAHDIDHPAMKVRVLGFDPVTHTYNFSCETPNSTPGSQISSRKFYAIDPIPQGHNRSYYSDLPYIAWDLDPVNYRELVHKKAIYHVYCEVQNFSAPAGQQNMASEFHVDLRTDDNKDVPDIYVLDSFGTRVTMKCEPPNHVQNYDLSWAYRSRSGRVDLAHLKNQQIVNITLPYAGAGWDVVCTVFDKFTGKSTMWDMPLETFEGRPAYVPTIEGCVPGEPCTWVHASGVPPASVLELTTSPGARVYINEVYKGTTDGQGHSTITGIAPGVHNLVIRKEGFAELSTLVPLAAGKLLTRSYSLQLPAPQPDPWNMCHTTIHSLPASCTGSITQDAVSGGCRTVACSSGSNSLKTLACNKGGFFEMYKQVQTGSGIKICLGNTCLQNEGYVKSPNYPICIGNGTSPNSTNTTAPPNSTNTTPPNTTPPNTTNTTQPPNTTNQTNTTETTNTCYSSLRNMPSTCEGASITSDTWNGGRTIICGDTRIQAWDKAGFFEMYRQSGAGNVKICIGSTCIRDNGYAKSTSFPICTNNTNNTNNTQPSSCIPSNETCDQKDNDCNGQVDENNVCGTTPPSACYSKVNDIPATCQGSITTDEKSSCRKFICQSNTGTIQVLACDKSGFFEMYKQAQAGVPPRLCLGPVCIQQEGFIRSGAYPLCI